MMTLTEIAARRERAYELALNARLEARAALTNLGLALRHARVCDPPDSIQEALANACDSLEESIKLVEDVPGIIDTAMKAEEEALLEQGRAIAATGTRVRVAAGRLQ